MITTQSKPIKKQEQIRIEPSGRIATMELVPGVRVADVPPPLIQRVGVCDWQPAGDGTYRPIVRLHDNMVRVSEAVKITGMTYLTLRRLICGGFVEGVQVTPGNVQMNMHSYWQHVQACRDPEFWTPERRRRYSATLGG